MVARPRRPPHANIAWQHRTIRHIRRLKPPRRTTPLPTTTRRTIPQHASTSKYVNVKQQNSTYTKKALHPVTPGKRNNMSRNKVAPITTTSCILLLSACAQVGEPATIQISAEQSINVRTASTEADQNAITNSPITVSNGTGYGLLWDDTDAPESLKLSNLRDDIDIGWIGDGGFLIKKDTATTCSSDTCPVTITPPEHTKAAALVKKHALDSLKIGDTLTFYSNPR
jgi:hypothetical protein